MTLSAFTHLWNPTGFPAFEQDEGHYMRRSMEVIQGLGPQESKGTFFYEYDHPYFGQIFLAAALSLVNYPNSLNPSINSHSIEMLYLVPRVLMGILAVVDTFLVYKIAETSYNRKVAFISATLFAVMSSTWFLRRIYLDSIALPFILLSILFAVYYAKKSESEYDRNIGNNKNIILILLSGIFLGLAIFTKLPVFTMIPLIVYIILKGSNRDTDGKKDTDGKNKNARTSSKLKTLGIWFIPIALIPMIWPAYAISMGQLDEWLDGVFWQATRADRPLAEALKSVFFRMDPVLLGLGAIGLIYSVIKKDYFILLWAFPYLIFMYFIDWVFFFHLIPVYAPFCIIGTILLLDILKKISNKQLCKVLEFIAFGSIIVFGFINSTLLITQNLNYSNFRLVSFVTKSLPDKNNGVDNNSEEVTLIGPNGAFSFYWIVSQVFNRNTEFKWFEGRLDYLGGPIKTEKFLIVVDKEMRNLFSSNSSRQHIKYVSQLYDKSNLFGVFDLNISLPDFKKYPYTNILDDVYKEHTNRRGVDWADNIEVRGNY